MSCLRTTTETVDGHRVRVARVGDGPPLVLLHGYPDNLQIWSALAPRLAARVEAVAFDWPGMGRSDAWAGGTTPRHMAARLRRLLDAWRLERVTLVAHDMGGQPALVFAAEHPERVAALVVMNSLVMPDAATSWDIRLLRRFGFNRFVIANLPRLVFARAVRTSLPRSTSLAADVCADLWTTFRRPDVRRFVWRMCAGYQASLPRLPASYPGVRARLLALWGGRDRHFPPAQGEALARAIDGARFALVEHGEHWMAWHAADVVAARVLEFVASG